LRETIKILAAILGFGTFLAGLVAGLIYLALPWLVPATQACQANISLAIVAVPGLTLGLGLAREALGALNKRPSERADLPPVIVLFLLFVGVLLLGPGALRDGRPGAYVFPLLFVLGIALPVTMIVRTVVHRAPAIVSRELTLQVAYGSLIATLLALLAEGVVMGGLAVVVIGSVALVPEGRAWLDDLARLAANPAALQDPANLQSLLLNPPVLTVAAIGGALVGPLIEELIKVLGVVAMAYRRPGRAQAFAWGVAAGAGFALAEGLLSGVMLASEWPQSVLLRVGASLLHATATGMVALGWFESATHRRLWALPLAYFAAVGLHGWWNALAVATTAVSAAGAAGQLAAPTATTISTGLVGLLGLTGLAVLVLFGALTGWATREEIYPHPQPLALEGQGEYYSPSPLRKEGGGEGQTRSGE
jgi:RsiW-degrading membrane proteinase PrsW (M82 family)